MTPEKKTSKGKDKKTILEILALHNLYKFTNGNMSNPGVGLFSKMSQWPVNTMPKMETSAESSLIPKEWQKANEALQEVQQPKAETRPSASNKSDPVPNNLVNYPYQYWPTQQQMFTYPGYQNYPGVAGYNFFNMDYSNFLTANNYYAMPTMGVPAQNFLVPDMSSKLSENSSTSSVPTKSETESSNVNDTVTFLASQPPPPPPSSPPVSGGEMSNSFSSSSTKQSPGSGGIRFNLPKRKAQQGNGLLGYQAHRGKTRNRRGMGYGQQNRPNYNYQQSESVSNNEKEPSQLKDGVDLFNTDNWPESLKVFVNESFSKCKTDLDKDQVEIILKGKLTKAFNDGSIWTKDWSAESLPSIHSERLLKEKDSPNKSYTPSRPSSPHTPKNQFIKRKEPYRRAFSRSKSRSRSKSPYARKVLRKRRYSSSSKSSDSNDGDRSSRKQVLSSSIVGPPSESRNSKGWHNQRPGSKKKNKKKGKKQSPTPPFAFDPENCTDDRLLKRAARFETVGGKKGRTHSLVCTINNPIVVDDPSDIDWGSFAIVGTSQDIEKPFLRLTGAVDPATIRPVEVLSKSLLMVKEHWVNNQDYHYACEQLKSIRQDLVVQCIRNNFTIQAYETHARIALEKGDHTEFNQCQSQLKVLYEETGEGNRLEFTGYHILYNIYIRNTREIKNILSSLSSEDKEEEVVGHALFLNSAWTLANYHKFFRLYINAPKMSGFIIDWFIERERIAALKTYIKSYRPTIPVSYIESELGFSSSEDCKAFLKKVNCLLTDDNLIDCKSSQVSLPAS